jgi:hypothetical protein
MTLRQVRLLLNSFSSRTPRRVRSSSYELSLPISRRYRSIAFLNLSSTPSLYYLRLVSSILSEQDVVCCSQPLSGLNASINGAAVSLSNACLCHSFLRTSISSSARFSLCLVSLVLVVWSRCHLMTTKIFSTAVRRHRTPLSCTAVPNVA